MANEMTEVRREVREIQELVRRGMSKHEVALEMVKLINGGRNYPTFEERRTMLMQLYRDVFLMMTEVEKAID